MLSLSFPSLLQDVNNPIVVDTPKIDAALQLYKQRGVTSSEVSNTPGGSDHDTAASRDMSAKLADVSKVWSIIHS